MCKYHLLHGCCYIITIFLCLQASIWEILDIWKHSYTGTDPEDEHRRSLSKAVLATYAASLECNKVPFCYFNS